MNEITSPDRPEIPSEQQIELLLRGIQPKPGSRFHQRMECQPWKRQGRNLLWAWIQPRGRTATLILALVLVLVLSLTSPSLKVLANRLARFFQPSSLDQITIQIPAEDLIDPEARFNLNISEAESLAGFRARIPSRLPTGFGFDGAEYHPSRNAVILNYHSNMGGILRISQRPIGVEYQNVSANASIEIVEMENGTGEYVSGGWKVTGTKIPEEIPSLQNTLQASWDPKASIQILRWQEGEMLYEIIFGGSRPGDEGYLDKNDLIDLAEDLQ